MPAASLLDKKTEVPYIEKRSVAVAEKKDPKKAYINDYLNYFVDLEIRTIFSESSSIIEETKLFEYASPSLNNDSKPYIYIYYTNSQNEIVIFVHFMFIGIHYYYQVFYPCSLFTLSLYNV